MHTCSLVHKHVIIVRSFNIEDECCLSGHGGGGGGGGVLLLVVVG